MAEQTDRSLLGGTWDSSGRWAVELAGAGPGPEGSPLNAACAEATRSEPGPPRKGTLELARRLEWLVPMTVTFF